MLPRVPCEARAKTVSAMHSASSLAGIKAVMCSRDTLLGRHFSNFSIVDHGRHGAHNNPSQSKAEIAERTVSMTG